jgi:hypothetical protein
MKANSPASVADLPASQEGVADLPAATGGGSVGITVQFLRQRGRFSTYRLYRRPASKNCGKILIRFI